MGANVTVPHKETVLHLLDEVDELADLIGAVNTIVKQGNKLVGFNTDAHGFVEALEKDGHFNAEGKRVVMLGAGGLARAAGLVLVQKKIASLAITDGVFERARALTRNLAKYGKSAAARAGESEASVTAFEWTDEESAGTFADCDLIVHCTTIGMMHSSQDAASGLLAETSEVPGTRPSPAGTGAYLSNSRRRRPCGFNIDSSTSSRWAAIG